MRIPFSCIPAIQVIGRVTRIIAAVGLATALCACSAVRLGYNNVDNIAYWWLDNYVEFTDAQAPLVREDLRRLHAWHRAQELPKLESLLHRIEQLAPSDISAPQACAFVPLAIERLNALADRAEPAVVTLAMSLQPEQLAHLERKYERNNANFRKDWIRISASELKAKRTKQLVERAEMIYGTLDEAQLAVVRQQMERSSYDPRRLLAERERRQQDLLQTLRKIAGQPVSISQARNLMRGYFERTQAPPDAAQRAAMQAWVDEGCRSFSALHNATTPQQRQSAVRRLRAYQTDLRELAGANDRGGRTSGGAPG